MQRLEARKNNTEAFFHLENKIIPNIYFHVKEVEVLFTCFLLHVTSNEYFQIGQTSNSFEKIRFGFYTITY